LRAAARRIREPFVRTAFRADARRLAADRRPAAIVAWRLKAFDEADRRPSRFKAFSVARERRDDGAFRRRAARLAYFALFFVSAEALAGGAGSLTPARRAFERPIATACLVDRAPCLPSRMW
jgi:hypothetical protein